MERTLYLNNFTFLILFFGFLTLLLLYKSTVKITICAIVIALYELFLLVEIIFYKSEMLINTLLTIVLISFIFDYVYDIYKGDLRNNQEA